MILSKSFYVPVEECLYQKIDSLLKDEYGLVDADPNKGFSTIGPLPPLNPEKAKVFVWEDETGIGRYRVHCFAQKHEQDGITYDLFKFSYWGNQRLTREIMEQDPMKPVLERFQQEVNNSIIADPDSPFFNLELTIDEIIESMNK